MAFSISKILDGMRDSYSPFDESKNEFIPINKENAEKTLELKERANKNGKSNIPIATSKTKDSIARGIDAFLSEAITLAKSQLYNRIRAIDELSGNQSKSDAKTKIDNEGRETRTELHTTVKSFAAQLFVIKRKLITGEREFKIFKKINRRIGPARFPQNRMRAFSWVFLIFCLEILLNAYTIGTAHPQSFAGAIIETIGFALVNAGAALLMGLFTWRFCNSVKFHIKFTGIFLSLLITIFIIFINLFFAHYRDALLLLNNMSSEVYIDTMGVLGDKARSTLIDAPLNLNDFKSYLLFIIGGGLALFTGFKAYETDDPYPAYGKIQREQDDLANGYETLSSKSHTNTSDIVFDFQNNILSLSTQDEVSQVAVNNRINDRKLLISKFESWLDTIEETGGALYEYYREENIKNRTDDQVPQSFVIEYSLHKNARNIDIIEVKKLNARESGPKLAEKWSNQLDKRLKKYHTLFKMIEDLSPETSTSEFKNIEKKISSLDKLDKELS
jgi:hypothetical protein